MCMYMPQSAVDTLQVTDDDDEMMDNANYSYVWVTV